MDERSPFVTAINGRHTLVKPPLSAGLRSGSVVLAPGESVGEHKTEGREEALVVLAGTATVVVEGEVFEVGAKQFAYIPPESIHNVTNRTDKPVEYVYVTAPVGDQPATEHSHNGHVHSH